MRLSPPPSASSWFSDFSFVFGFVKVRPEAAADAAGEDMPVRGDVMLLRDDISRGDGDVMPPPKRGEAIFERMIGSWRGPGMGSFALQGNSTSFKGRKHFSYSINDYLIKFTQHSSTNRENFQSILQTLLYCLQSTKITIEK